MPNPTAQAAAAYFESILGTPYGTGPGQLDCSGAWRAFFLQYGISYPGVSNYQYRDDMTEKGRVTSVQQLEVGMAVFKHRIGTGDDARWNDDGIGDMYHVGCVTSLNPFRICHATPPVAKVDTVYSSSWSYYGWFKNLDRAPIQQVVLFQAKVTTVSGTLNMRSGPASTNPVISTIPQGATVDVYQNLGAWYKVGYNGMVGYCASQYLTQIIPTDIPDPDPEEPPLVNREWALVLPMSSETDATMALSQIKAFLNAMTVKQIIKEG